MLFLTSAGGSRAQTWAAYSSKKTHKNVIEISQKFAAQPKSGFQPLVGVDLETDGCFPFLIRNVRFARDVCQTECHNMLKFSFSSVPFSVFLHTSRAKSSILHTIKLILAHLSSEKANPTWRAQPLASHRRSSFCTDGRFLLSVRNVRFARYVCQDGINYKSLPILPKLFLAFSQLLGNNFAQPCLKGVDFDMHNCAGFD